MILNFRLLLEKKALGERESEAINAYSGSREPHLR